MFGAANKRNGLWSPTQGRSLLDRYSVLHRINRKSGEPTWEKKAQAAETTAKALPQDISQEMGTAPPTLDSDQPCHHPQLWHYLCRTQASDSNQPSLSAHDPAPGEKEGVCKVGRLCRSPSMVRGHSSQIQLLLSPDKSQLPFSHSKQWLCSARSVTG